MRDRTAHDVIIGIGIALGIAIISVWLQAGFSLHGARWLTALRHTPALWALDGCAVLLGAQVALSRLRVRAERNRQEQISEERSKQLKVMISQSKQLEETNAKLEESKAMLEETNTQLEGTNTKLEEMDAKLEQASTQQAERFNELKAEVATRQATLEDEVRHLTEQAFRTLSGQVEVNTRQLTAVNLALQHHRAEIQQLRQVLRTQQPALDYSQLARLTPEELAAIHAEDDYLDDHFDTAYESAAAVSDTQETEEFPTPDIRHSNQATGNREQGTGNPESTIDNRQSTIDDVRYSTPFLGISDTQEREAFPPAEESAVLDTQWDAAEALAQIPTGINTRPTIDTPPDIEAQPTIEEIGSAPERSAPSDWQPEIEAQPEVSSEAEPPAAPAEIQHATMPVPSFFQITLNAPSTIIVEPPALAIKPGYMTPQAEHAAGLEISVEPIEQSPAESSAPQPTPQNLQITEPEREQARNGISKGIKPDEPEPVEESTEPTPPQDGWRRRL